MKTKKCLRYLKNYSFQILVPEKDKHANSNNDITFCLPDRQNCKRLLTSRYKSLVNIYIYTIYIYIYIYSIYIYILFKYILIFTLNILHSHMYFLYMKSENK
jgi:hypothetical protein